MKIKLIGYESKPIDVKTLEVHVDYEGYIWLRFLDAEGRQIYETGLLREVDSA